MSAALDLTPPKTHPAVERERANHLPCHGIARQGWIVLLSHPQAELWANSNLQRRGYRTFLPLVTVRRRDRVTRSLWHTVRIPLFARYLFCWHNTAEPRRPIRETPGVRDIVRFGSDTPLCPEGAVEALQSALQAADALAATEPPWKPGSPCSVLLGPGNGMPAVVLSVGADMALVSLLMLGQLREVAVSLDCLSVRDD